MNFKTINGANYIEKGAGNVLLWVPGIDQVAKGADQIYRDSPIFKYWDAAEPPIRIIALQLQTKDRSKAADYVIQFVKDMKILPYGVGWSYGGAVMAEVSKRAPELFTGFAFFAMADVSDTGYPGKYALFVHDSNDDRTSVVNSHQAFNAWPGPKDLYAKPYWGHYSTWVKFFSLQGLEGVNMYDTCNELAGTPEVPPAPEEIKQWHLKGPDGVYRPLGYNEPDLYLYK